MTHNINASKYAGNNGISVDSEYGLWGTTTRKLKFRISSACCAFDKEQNSIKCQFDFTNMPAIKRATLVPESFALSLNARPDAAGNINVGAMVPTGWWGLTGGPNNLKAYTSVCLRCPQLSQPNSYDNGAVLVNAPGAPAVPPDAQRTAQHGSFQGNSNIIMSMAAMDGDAIGEGADRNYQHFKTWSGNEYDCGIELQNNCFQSNEWDFQLTNEWGNFFQMGGNVEPDVFYTSWYAEFSIVYEEEKTDHELN